MENLARLTAIATPIGNLGDLSPRAKICLSEADVWFVEDTRVSGQLQRLLEINVSMKRLDEHTNSFDIQKYARQIQESNLKACIVSDAGTPCVSDPGAMLIDAAYELDIEVDSLPGPSAVSNALVLSGFFAQRYAFLGFLARKAGPIKKELLQFADSAFTLVFFESVHRVDDLLACCHEVLGDRRYAICREMTKMHQQVYRNRLPHRPTELDLPHKGELTLVIEGKRKSQQ